MRTSLSVAIPTYGREHVLLNTITHVLAQDPPAQEILVIDQTPEHEPSTELSLGRWHADGRIRWIRHSPPNLPGARNRALRETQCDVILFIDDDVVLPKQFVGLHLKNYRNPDISAVAGRVVEKNWKAPPRPRRKWPPLMDSAFLDRGGMRRIEGVGGVPGVNHSVRVSALKAIGGYDEKYSVGPAIREESDMAARLWKAGYRIDFDPDAWLVHLATPAGGCRENSQWEPWMRSFSQLYFAFKHLYPGYWFWEHVLYRMARSHVFCRKNLLQPWRLPGALLAYAKAITVAQRTAASTRVSSPENVVGPCPGLTH